LRRHVRRLEALEAFTPTTDDAPPPAAAVAQAGDPIGLAGLHDLAGAEVVIDRDVVAEDIRRVRLGDLETRDSLVPLLAAAADPQGHLIAYRLQRGTGGLTFTLTDTTGRMVRFGPDRLMYLAHAQPIPSDPRAQ